MGDKKCGNCKFWKGDREKAKEDTDKNYPFVFGICNKIEDLVWLENTDCYSNLEINCNFCCNLHENIE